MKKLIFWAIVMFLPGAASAVEFYVDPGDFSGSYQIDRMHFAEDHKYDLPAGRHFFHVAPGLAFWFKVNPDGTLETENEYAAEVQVGPDGTTENLLSIITQEITIKRGAYEGAYSLVNPKVFKDTPEPATGRVYNIIPRLGRYSIYIAPGNAFFFTLDESNQVVPERPETATGGTGELTFKTVNLTVEVGEYKGDWFIRGAHDANLSGDHTVPIIPATNGYTFGFAPSNAFFFDMRADGSANVTRTEAAVETTGGLRLEAAVVTVTPLDNSVNWYVRGAERRPGATGTREVVLPRDVRGWILEVAPGTNARFDTLPNGTPQPDFRSIFHNGSYRDFQLSTASGPVVCAFSVDMKLESDISDELPAGSVVHLNARFEVDEADRNPPVPTSGVYAFNGPVNIEDDAGNSVSVSNGFFLFALADSQHEMMITLADPEGNLGGKEWAGPTNWGLHFFEPGATVLPNDSFQRQIGVWNQFSRRLSTTRGFGPLVTFSIDDFVHRLDCE